MTDERKLYRDEQRGRQAETALQNDILRETFSTLRRSYIAAWTITDSKDVEGRENLWRCIQILDDVENNMKTVARNGRIARADLEQIARKFEAEQARKLKLATSR